MIRSLNNPGSNLAIGNFHKNISFLWALEKTKKRKRGREWPIFKNKTLVDTMSMYYNTKWSEHFWWKRLSSKWNRILLLQFFVFTFSSSWDNFKKTFVSDATVSKILTSCLRTNCHPNSAADILQALARCRPQMSVAELGDVSSATTPEQRMIEMVEKKLNLAR